MQATPAPAHPSANDPHGQPSPGHETHGHGGSHVEKDDINVGLLSVIFALVAVSFVLVVALLQAWFYNLTNDITASLPGSLEDPQSLVSRATIDQQDKFNSYHWINQKANERAVPISRAMELVVADLKDKSGQNAGEKSAEKSGDSTENKSSGGSKSTDGKSPDGKSTDKTSPKSDEVNNKP